MCECGVLVCECDWEVMTVLANRCEDMDKERCTRVCGSVRLRVSVHCGLCECDYECSYMNVSAFL